MQKYVVLIPEHQGALAKRYRICLCFNNDNKHLVTLDRTPGGLGFPTRENQKPSFELSVAQISELCPTSLINIIISSECALSMGDIGRVLRTEA